jgi:hypothetical protein
MNRKLVLEKRDEVVAAKITEYLKATDRNAKTIVFCEDIDHAARMRQALATPTPTSAPPSPDTWCRSPATTPRASASSTTSSTPRRPTR